MSDLWMEVDATGRVRNVIRYDGTSPYDPSEGVTLIPWDEDAKPWVGWTRNADGTWTAPPAPEEQS